MLGGSAASLETLLAIGLWARNAAGNCIRPHDPRGLSGASVVDRARGGVARFGEWVATPRPHLNSCDRMEIGRPTTPVIARSAILRASIRPAIQEIPVGEPEGSRCRARGDARLSMSPRRKAIPRHAAQPPSSECQIRLGDKVPPHTEALKVL
jgi:hypothetical protein